MTPNARPKSFVVSVFPVPAGLENNTSNYKIPTKKLLIKNYNLWIFTQLELHPLLNVRTVLMLYSNDLLVV